MTMSHTPDVLRPHQATERRADVCAQACPAGARVTETRTTPKEADHDDVASSYPSSVPPDGKVAATVQLAIDGSTFTRHLRG